MLDLLNPAGIGALDTPEQMKEAISLLRSDFASHNHDGNNSARILNLIAETIQAKNAIIGGYQLFEAVVAKTGGNFTKIGDAIAAGKTRIFVRNGSYIEDPWTISRANTVIVGETMMGVQVTFQVDTHHSGNSVYIDASAFLVDKMKFYNYDAAGQNLFHFTSNGIYPSFSNLHLTCSRGKFFDSDNGSGGAVNVYGNVSNIFLDVSFTNDIDSMFPFNNVNHINVNKMIISCGSLDPGAGKTFKVAVSCSQINFMECDLIATHASNEPSLGDSALNRWIGSYFYGTAFAVNGNFSECMFESNGNTPSTYFAKPSLANSKIVGSRIKAGTSIDILRISGTGVACSGNIILGGKRVRLDHDSDIFGSTFSNNVWVSDYDTAAMDVSISNHAVKFMVLGNTIRNNKSGASNTPTITDGGISTIGVATNQLVLG